MKPPATLLATCDRARVCAPRASASAQGTRAELEAAGWLPCPRKGGKLAWICPACDPTKGAPPGFGTTTR